LPSSRKAAAAVAESAAAQVAEILIRGLRAGSTVEIEELGTFFPDRDRGFRFEPRRLPQVFVAHVKEDAAAAGRLAGELEADGFQPWMDTRKLLPGQNWPRAIENAIENSDFFVACFSANSIGKRGGFQAEIRYALDCARHVPLEDVFIVPVRLDGCAVPRSIQRELQYVDLFENWQRGIARVTAIFRREWKRRQARMKAGGQEPPTGRARA
jgi:hypothetical protein